MTEPEYRSDDTSDGYCPQCGEPLSGLTVAGRGYCDRHGWTWAEWNPPIPLGGSERFYVVPRQEGYGVRDRDTGTLVADRLHRDHAHRLATEHNRPDDDERNDAP